MKFVTEIASLVLGAMIATSACSAARAQAITLRYSNWLPPTYAVNTDILYPWIEDVRVATEGRVKIEITPKVVGTVAGQFDVIADGLADLALIVPAYTPGRFPIVDGLEMPFLGDVATTRAPATWRTYEKFIAPLDVFKGVKILSIFSSNAAHIFTSQKELSSLAAFDGAKLRSPSPTVNKVIEALGGVPINKPATETYELAAGGVIDGAIVPPESMTGFKLQGILKRMTYLPGGIANTMLVWGINPEKWAQISEKDQKAILALSGEAMAKRAGDAHQRFSDAAMEKMKAEGLVVLMPDEKATAEIVAAVEPVREGWYEAARAAGLKDPKAMLDFLTADIASHTK